MCCKSTRDCLVDVGPGANLQGLTNKTYQHALFESLTKELENEPSQVEGRFPTWAAGSMFKNGFGKYESTKSNYTFLSVFDAMGYTARITIEKDGSVHTTAKFTRNDWYNRSEGIGKYNTPHNPPYRSFMGTEPELSFWGKIRLLFTIVPDNLNVNIVRQGKRLFGISDMEGFNEIDPKTMEYVDYFRYSDSLSMTTSILSLLAVMTSAHPVFRASSPHIVYNFVALPGGYLPSVLLLPTLASILAIYISHRLIRNVSSQKSTSAFIKFATFLVLISQLRWSLQAIDGQVDGVHANKYVIYRLDTSKEPLHREAIAEFPNKRLSYLHEMAITKNYLVLVEWPTFWNIASINTPLFNDPAKLTLTWDPTAGTKITVIDTNKGKVVSEHTDLGPYWSYHHINAYEDGNGNIVMDACTFDSGEHLHTFETRTLKRNTYFIPPNVNRRFIVPVGRPNEKIIVQNVGPVGFDLPTKNPEYAARKYRFGYGTGHRSHGEWWNTIVKVDMDTGKTMQWFEEHTWPSQPVFIPNPERKSEDHGLLLTLMYDGKSKRSFVLGLDGETMNEVGRAWISVGLPYTSHGYFDVEYGGDAQSTVIPGVKNGFTVN
jgi:carotenoid cleavage dioxygenase-like enzyme